MTNPAHVTDSQEFWHVRLGNGATRVLSLDDLDRAFQDGWVDEHSLVSKTGTAPWVPLGQVAGLDDDVTNALPQPNDAAPYSIAPLALDTGASDLEVRLDDLRSGDALAAYDAQPDPTFLGQRSRRWPKVMKVASIVAVLGVLGGVGFQRRPQIKDAIAAATGQKAAEAALAAATQAKAKAEADAKAKAKAEADAKAKADGEAKAKADADAKAEAKAKADAAVPTLSLASLPNAKKGAFKTSIGKKR